MQVILDVVFNHTAEGNEKGPTLSFRGLDNRVYYMLAPLGEYYNYRSVTPALAPNLLSPCFLGSHERRWNPAGWPRALTLTQGTPGDRGCCHIFKLGIDNINIISCLKH